MEKVIRDNLVAVLYSPGFGTGWSTWHDTPDTMFDSRIVEKVEQSKQAEITEEFMESIGYTGCYCGGAKDLKIEWVPEGGQFDIQEYDGSESITVIGRTTYPIA